MSKAKLMKYYICVHRYFKICLVFEIAIVISFIRFENLLKKRLLMLNLFTNK